MPRSGGCSTRARRCRSRGARPPRRRPRMRRWSSGRAASRSTSSVSRRRRASWSSGSRPGARISGATKRTAPRSGRGGREVGVAACRGPQSVRRPARPGPGRRRAVADASRVVRGAGSATSATHGARSKAVRTEVAQLDVERATAESDLTHLASACVESLQATLDEVAAEVEQLEAAGLLAAPRPVDDAPDAAEVEDEDGVARRRPAEGRLEPDARSRRAASDGADAGRDGRGSCAPRSNAWARST